MEPDSISSQMSKALQDFRPDARRDLDEALDAFRLKLLVDLGSSEQDLVSEDKKVQWTRRASAPNISNVKAPRGRLVIHDRVELTNLDMDSDKANLRRNASSLTQDVQSINAPEASLQATLPDMGSDFSEDRFFVRKTSQFSERPSSAGSDLRGDDDKDGTIQARKSRMSRWSSQSKPRSAVVTRKMSGSRSVIVSKKINRSLSKQQENVRSQLRKAQQTLEGSEPETCLDWFKQVVTSSAFDLAIGMIVCLNAISIGVQVQVNASGSKEELTFDIINVLFVVLFTAELLARLLVTQRQFFVGENVVWNLFDSLVVVWGLADLLIKTVMANPDSGMMDTLSILRLGRLLRMLRLFRLIPALKQLCYLLLASASSFIWAALLMLIMMYCFAVFLTDQGTEFVRRSEVPEDRVKVQEYWGSMGSSIKSLFMAMTGGIDWRHLVEHIGRNWLTACVFYGYITFSVLVMLNLVTGVFVDGAQRIIKEDKENDVIRLAAEAFAKLDVDMSGDISFEEFSSHLEDDSILNYCEAVGMLPDQALDLFQVLDANDNGELSISEFVEGCLRLRSEARSYEVACLTVLVKELMSVVKKDTQSILQQIAQLQRSSGDI